MHSFVEGEFFICDCINPHFLVLQMVNKSLPNVF